MRDWLLEDFGEAQLHFEIRREPWCEAELRSKSNAVISGAIFVQDILDLTQELLGFGVSDIPKIQWLKQEGDIVENGDLLAQISGCSQTILKAERTVLNLISHMSEIATHTKNVLSSIQDYPETFKGILDTRKNRPGLRYFEKYAVRTGGGKNHRLGFFDGDMIKDNDIVAAGSISAAIDRQYDLRYMTDIQIEVQSFEQLDEVLEDGRVHMLLLDNMNLKNLKDAVARIRKVGDASVTKKTYILEASGIGDTSILDVALTGVDYISTSNLVRSAPPLDFSLKIVRLT
ncbi:MAG: carboxylating nicotinate-nucleotide diphosphorylase [Nitrospinota bacterium]|nr:carboxylating nicotinate-nucleotide diphosphorylase [Nitrospinota bacterium]